jgi:hypothetical protein
MFKYPWKRDSLITHLNVMSDFEYQKKNWGQGRTMDCGWDGLYPNMEFALNDEILQEEAHEWVGIYIYENEVEPLEKFAKAFDILVDDLDSLYDDYGAINHKDWPNVVRLAGEALAVVLSNNEKEIKPISSI